MNQEQRSLVAAYHDRELDSGRMLAARQLLASDAEAQVYLDELRRCDSLLHSAFDPIVREPVPDILQAAVQACGRRPFGRFIMPLALAASLALLAVVVWRQVDTDSAMQQQLSEMQLQITQLRHQALENTPSGSAASWVAPTGGVRAEVIPLKTYRTSDNRFCREYEERIEGEGGVEVRRGIACRAGKTLWPDQPVPATPGIATEGTRGVRL